MAKIRLNLNIVTNVAVLAVCAMWAVRFATVLYDNERRAGRPIPAYTAGTTVHAPIGSKLTEGRVTLLVISRSTCPYCRASMPFYRKVTAVARRAGVRIVGLSAEDVEGTRKFLESYGVHCDSVVSTAAGGITVQAVPALVLVRGNGKVINSWAGKLDEASEGDVLRAISGS